MPVHSFRTHTLYSIFFILYGVYIECPITSFKFSVLYILYSISSPTRISQTMLNKMRVKASTHVRTYDQKRPGGTFREGVGPQSSHFFPEGASRGVPGVPGPPVQSLEAPFCLPLRGPKFKKRDPKTKKNANSRRTEKVLFEAPLSHFSGVRNSREALVGPMSEPKIQKNGVQKRSCSQNTSQTRFCDFERFVSTRAHVSMFGSAFGWSVWGLKIH